MILSLGLRRLYWILSEQLGVDPRKAWLSLRGLPRYLGGLRDFRAGYRGRLSLTPVCTTGTPKGVPHQTNIFGRTWL